ncbi:ABC-type transport auxiliary lipoprotein family protein [Pseudoduganella sp. GCM10020061]|uniref:ABC-type transport auxiliary lipoprotein family protein n=1 Tax=Pseudoduganella sp. GCM10020061 TaxID=3317345 RepID=UPI00363060CC
MTRLLATIAILTVLAGCAATRGGRGQGNVQFDFGPLPATAPAAAATQLPPLVIPNVTGPASLDNQRMLYRLNYANPMQARFYSQNHWASTPLDLITQRIKARIAQGGTKVLSATDASNGAYLLRIEVDDFAHTFASTTESAGVVRLRASLFEGSRFIDQKTFVQSMPAPSADASGGAHALAAATDAVSDGIMAWIGSLPPRPR